MTTDFVLDALEQALYARQPGEDGTLIHHSDSKNTRTRYFRTITILKQAAFGRVWCRRAFQAT
ncbi:hypothetical protein, partial [Burkholderia plantarii]|uniref:hypothetical protein n=1 Tax=Burkholderia plantarii TaxID=41899 RepID=UPI001ABAC3B5